MHGSYSTAINDIIQPLVVSFQLYLSSQWPPVSKKCLEVAEMAFCRPAACHNGPPPPILPPTITIISLPPKEQQPFYGHYTGQQVLVGTPSWEPEHFVGAKYYYLHTLAEGN